MSSIIIYLFVLFGLLTYNELKSLTIRNHYLKQNNNIISYLV